MDKKPATINEIEDAAAVRWLARTLAPARARARVSPTHDALERMRSRVFGEMPRKRDRERIAA
jgi:hypothetical protein